MMGTSHSGLFFMIVSRQRLDLRFMEEFVERNENARKHSMELWREISCLFSFLFAKYCEHRFHGIDVCSFSQSKSEIQPQPLHVFAHSMRNEFLFFVSVFREFVACSSFFLSHLLH